MAKLPSTRDLPMTFLHALASACRRHCPALLATLALSLPAHLRAAPAEDSDLSLSFASSLKSLPAQKNNAAPAPTPQPPGIKPLPEGAVPLSPLAPPVTSHTPALPLPTGLGSGLSINATSLKSGEGQQAIEIPAPLNLPRTIDLTTPSDDLWERMRNGFAMPNLNNELVLYHQNWYLSRPDYLRRMIERSRRYIHHIVEELEKRGMPTELALLPMVESAYNPMALSRSQAMGLWQFIPATGKTFKLEQNWWHDQRRDILASTSAALEYLQTIYDMHGDWFLALASYNWGEGAVARAIAKNRAKGMPTDYESINMPAETRNYVPKLQALKNIINSPRLFAQLDLGAIPNRPYFSTLSTPRDMDVKVAARLADMPLNEFLALNPSHNRPVIRQDASLILPADKLDTFNSNLDTYQRQDKPLTSWRAYTLQKGERLEQIAARTGTSVAELRSVNSLPAKGRIGAGTTLLVPGIDSDGVINLSQPKVVVEPEPVRQHHVVKGDTVDSLARKYHIAAADLKRWNKLKTNTPRVGAKLIVGYPDSGDSDKPAAKTSPAPAVLAKAETATADKGGKADAKGGKHDKPAGKPEKTDKNGKADKNDKRSPAKSVQHTVKAGDTVYSIARRYDLTPDELRRKNKLKGNEIKPGQALQVQ